MSDSERTTDIEPKLDEFCLDSFPLEFVPWFGKIGNYPIFNPSDEAEGIGDS